MVYIQDLIETNDPIIGLGVYNQYEGSGYGTSFTNYKLKVVYTVPTPPAPTNLTTTTITAGKIALAWDASAGDVTGYNVYKNGTLYGTTTSTQMQVCNLYPGSPYSFYVKAYNTSGEGDQSLTINPSTLPSAISGPPLVCTTGSYGVNNVPSGSTLTWTSPSNLTLVSDEHANPCTFQKYTNGNGMIVAVISSSCENYNRSKQVHTGPYSSSDYPISGARSAQCYSYVYYSIPQLTGVTSINWAWPQGWTYVSGQNSRYLALRTGTQSGVVAVGVNNTCGQSGSYSRLYTSVYGCYGYYLLISPNPVSDIVTIILKKVEETNISNDTISTNISTGVIEKPQNYKVIITDNMGVIYYSDTKYENSFTLSVQNLKNGNYIIVVDDGKERYSASLVVLH